MGPTTLNRIFKFKKKIIWNFFLANFIESEQLLFSFADSAVFEHFNDFFLSVPCNEKNDTAPSMEREEGKRE